METPRKYYRIFTFGPNGQLVLFNTAEFGEPNNWFDSELDAHIWMNDHFVDVNEGAPIVLTVLPIWTVKSK